MVREYIGMYMYMYEVLRAAVEDQGSPTPRRIGADPTPENG
jgi:hypothetical protein